MPQYLYQAAYAPESIAAQIKNPEDRLAKVGAQIEGSVGAKIVAGGFCYGEYDIAVVVEAPDEEAMVAVAMVISAGGAIRSAKTTPLVSSEMWVAALGRAASITYTPAR